MSEDKELDDLLDSALDDFGTKLSISGNSNVTVENTNLYVDDIDYEDRPTPKLFSTAAATSTKASASGSSSSSKSTLFKNDMPSKPAVNSEAASATGEDAFDMNDDDMKMFEEIFSDEKTKESMKQFKEAFSMFKTGGDEKQLLDNFQKVIAQLADENLDDNEDDRNAGAGINFGDELDFLKNFAAAASATTATTESKKPSGGIFVGNNDQPLLNMSDAASTSNADSSSEPAAATTAKTPLNKVLDDMNRNSEKVLNSQATGSSSGGGGGFPFDLLSSLGGSASDGSGDGLDGASSLMMEPILSMLFSKEILYPSLRLMLDNYDKYLEERRATMSEQEVRKCVEQKACIGEMCSVYEQASADDTQAAKAEQLRRILDLLEKCGMPPQELVPDVNPFEGLGAANACPVS